MVGVLRNEVAIRKPRHILHHCRKVLVIVQVGRRIDRISPDGPPVCCLLVRVDIPFDGNTHFRRFDAVAVIPDMGRNRHIGDEVHGLANSPPGLAVIFIVPVIGKQRFGEIHLAVRVGVQVRIRLVKSPFNSGYMREVSFPVHSCVIEMGKEEPQRFGKKFVIGQVCRIRLCGIIKVSHSLV